MNQEERRKEAWGTRHDKRLRAGVIRGENTNKREAQKGAEKKREEGKRKGKKGGRADERPSTGTFAVKYASKQIHSLRLCSFIL